VLATRPTDAQALLTRATILRVLGRYTEAGRACEQFAATVEPQIAALCRESLRSLRGELASAYAVLRSLSPQGWLNAERSWLYSELGEMAVRLGLETDAERWFLADLKLTPGDVYVRAAYSDLLLRQGRAREVLSLLQGQDSFEPLLLRMAIAQQGLRDPRGELSRARLRNAFEAECARGEVVHRREQARYLLEIEQRPALALETARANWQQQREPEDALVLLAAAWAAGSPAVAAPALEFIYRSGLEDARLQPYLQTAPSAMRARFSFASTVHTPTVPVAP